MSLLTIPKGTKIFEEGDQSKSAYLIKKGIVRIFKKKGESTIEIETFRAGQLLGELAFLDNQPRSASAEAIIDCEIVEISQHILDDTLNKTPEWLKILLKTISARLRNASNKIRALESATSEYETDKWGNRSREFVYVTQSELLRFCTALLVTATRSGTDSPSLGILFPESVLERYAGQILQINAGKIVHLIEIFKTSALLRNGPDQSPSPQLFLTDIEFLDRFVRFANEQNIAEPGKQRSLSIRGFVVLGLMVKGMSKAVAGKEGTEDLNLVPILEESKNLFNPPIRPTEFQELVDQKFLNNINLVSSSEIVANFNKEKLIFEFKAFRIFTEVDTLNERKRKAK